MTKEECFKKLKDAQENDADDPEVAHADAEAAICDFLTELGHGDIVAAYKWYA